MKQTNPNVDFYFNKASKWHSELEHLRIIPLECGLTEELKWGVPCYTINNHNIVLIHSFKEYCAVLLFKGALLKDPKGILVQQTENVQSARQIRFTNEREIVKLHATLKSYIHEAIEVEKAGLKVKLKTNSEYNIPDEFQTALDGMPELHAAFRKLTPGRQRGYLLHFSSPKQSATRMSRIEKNIKNILNGKGLHD